MKRNICTERSIGKGQLAKVVARPELNPEKDSDGIPCAESADGWETFRLFIKWKNPTTTTRKKHNVN